MNTSMSATSEALRIQFASASVTGAASVSAIAVFIARMSGAASLSVTTTSASDRIRLVSAAASTAVTATNAFSRIRGMDASVEVVTTVDGQAVGVFVTSGGVSFALNQVCLAQILGDAWTVVDEGTETWADQNRHMGDAVRRCRDLDRCCRKLGDMDRRERWR